ncbi:MAG: AMP-binding protein [Theionarchaea archaeon]|nr:AMP-binding protein [Theionarchaea archaeon]
MLSYAHTGSRESLLWITIGDVVKHTAESFPSHDALIAVWLKKRYTYKKFYEICCQAARGFMSLGIERGDRVAIWATNCPEWVITQVATALIGAILVPINPAFREQELEYTLSDSQSQTLLLMEHFKTSHYLAMLENVCPEITKSDPGGITSSVLPFLKNVILLGEEEHPGLFTWEDLLHRGKEVSKTAFEERRASLDPDDIINIQYTSGTTGFPKGASLTHFNIVNNAYFVAKNMKFSSLDRLCIPVPFYHCFGMVLSNMVCMITGAAMVLPAEYFNPEYTLRAVEQEKCTALHGVPTMFITELDNPVFENLDLSSLRTGIMAGAPCPVEIMKRVIEDMGASEITIAYGLTEASPVTNQTRIDDSLELRVETVGPPLAHTEIKIVNPDTGRVQPIGTVGELCCRGFQVMKGYYNKPTETAQTIDRDNWLHTGDLAVMDEKGYCQITSRIKDMIIRGGENIYPREIEEFLHTHPKIIDAYVFGVPDKKYGEEIAAWIQLKEGVQSTPEEIMEFCRGKISHQKIPRYIKFVEEFPMTVTGKIQKFKMREMATSELGLKG